MGVFRSCRAAKRDAPISAALSGGPARDLLLCTDLLMCYFVILSPHLELFCVSVRAGPLSAGCSFWLFAQLYGKLSSKPHPTTDFGMSEGHLDV